MAQTRRIRLHMTLRHWSSHWLLAVAAVAVFSAASCGGSDEPVARDFALTINGGELTVEPSPLEVKADDEVTLTITSDAGAESIHLHGYDIEVPVHEGEDALMVFTAEAEGQFTITLHGYGAQPEEPTEGEATDHDEEEHEEEEITLGALIVQPR